MSETTTNAHTADCCDQAERYILTAILLLKACTERTSDALILCSELRDIIRRIQEMGRP